MLGLQYSDSDSEPEQESAAKIESSIPKQTIFTRPNILEKSPRHNPLSSTDLEHDSQRVSTTALANGMKDMTSLRSQTGEKSEDGDDEDDEDDEESGAIDIAALITKARLLSGRNNETDSTSVLASTHTSVLSTRGGTESALLPVTVSSPGKGSTSMFMNYMKQLQASEQEQTPGVLKQQHERTETTEMSFAFSVIPNNAHNSSAIDTATNHTATEDTTISPSDHDAAIDYKSLYSHIGASAKAIDRSPSHQSILPSKSKGGFPQNVKVVDIDVNAMRALTADEQQAMILDQAAKYVYCCKMTKGISP